MFSNNSVDHLNDWKVVVFDRDQSQLSLKVISILFDVIGKPFEIVSAKFNQEEIAFYLNFEFVKADEVKTLLEMDHWDVINLQNF